MGIYHFMGVGKAVGPVTCAVDYIEKSLTQLSTGKKEPELLKLFSGSGGINHNEEDKGKIEALVLFSSKEVIAKELAAFAYNECENPKSVREEIERQLRKVWKRVDLDEGRKIFWVEVDIDNYQDCFEKAMKVAYRFSPPGKQGKEIWLNLTGGTNAINLALVSMGRLTGVSTKHYLISQARAYQKFVSTPPNINILPNKDGYFNVLPFVKLAVDTVNFYEILLELEQVDSGVTNEELFSRMCNRRVIFSSLTLDEFVRDYMLRLFGLGYTEHDPKTLLTFISQEGRLFVGDLNQLDIALELEEDLRRKNIDIVEESNQWSWFQSLVLT